MSPRSNSLSAGHREPRPECSGAHSSVRARADLCGGRGKRPDCDAHSSCVFCSERFSQSFAQRSDGVQAIVTLRPTPRPRCYVACSRSKRHKPLLFARYAGGSAVHREIPARLRKPVLSVFKIRSRYPTGALLKHDNSVMCVSAYLPSCGGQGGCGESAAGLDCHADRS